MDGPRQIKGAVKGSFPIDGGYRRYEYPNWAAKFLADSLLLEMDLTTSGQESVARASASEP
jgi:hypothetical protein